ANAQRRALLLGESAAVPRISDLHAVYPSTMGKLELETFGAADDSEVIDHIIGEAIRRVFVQYVDDAGLESLVAALDAGRAIDISERTPAATYPDLARGIDGLHAVLWNLTGN